jgi:hypothetical protein
MPTLAALLNADVALLGIVVALVLFIVVFSAIVLYLAFRIKETFREGRGRGMVTAKVAFLVGVLFLAGSGFYFLAQAFSTRPPAAGAANPELILGLSYPPDVQRNARFNASFTISNPTEYVAHGAAIQADVLFQKFTVLSSNYGVTGNTVTLGDVPRGTVVVLLELKAPDLPGAVSDTLTLVFAEAVAPPTRGITITVTGGP